MGERYINAAKFQTAFAAVSQIMSKNKDYLVELDQQNGDGDLGISMDAGFKAVAAYLAETTETDLGRLMMQSGKLFNETSPSSLGTILSFALMGMAKALKGNSDTDLTGLACAMEKGVELIMEKAGSKAGEKTILDALLPGTAALKEAAENGSQEPWSQAAKAAAEGSESTRAMRSVHGRAAYYGDKSIGILDGGSVVGRLIFEALADMTNA